MFRAAMRNCSRAVLFYCFLQVRRSWGRQAPPEDELFLQGRVASPSGVTVAVKPSVPLDASSNANDIHIEDKDIGMGEQDVAENSDDEDKASSFNEQPAVLASLLEDPADPNPITDYKITEYSEYKNPVTGAGATDPIWSDSFDQLDDQMLAQQGKYGRRDLPAMGASYTDGEDKAKEAEGDPRGRFGRVGPRSVKQKGMVSLTNRDFTERMWGGGYGYYPGAKVAAAMRGPGAAAAGRYPSFNPGYQRWQLEMLRRKRFEEMEWDVNYRQAKWVKHQNRNCYYRHGATTWGDNDRSAKVGLTVRECKLRCDESDKCDCVVYARSKGKCWLRENCQPTLCKKAAWSSLYVKLDVGKVMNGIFLGTMMDGNVAHSGIFMGEFIGTFTQPSQIAAYVKKKHEEEPHEEEHHEEGAGEEGEGPGEAGEGDGDEGEEGGKKEVSSMGERKTSALKAKHRSRRKSSKASKTNEKTSSVVESNASHLPADLGALQTEGTSTALVVETPPAVDAPGAVVETTVVETPPAVDAPGAVVGTTVVETPPAVDAPAAVVETTAVETPPMADAPGAVVQTSDKEDGGEQSI